MPTPRRARLAALGGVAVVVALSGCVTNQVGSARNGGIYTSKAVRSAESALSAVSTVQLVAGAAADGKVFREYASVSIDQQEDAITEIAALFRSIQPPDDASIELRSELGGLLDAARDHIAAVRIDVRKGHLSDAATTARPLADDAEQLQAFVDENG